MNLKTVLLAITLLTLPGAAIRAASTDSNPAGQRLAAELRNLPPAENSETTGVLKIVAGKTRTEIPIRSQVLLEGKSWKTIYTTINAGSHVASQMVVIHSIDRPNEYLYAHSKETGATNLSNRLTAEVSLAGSDFSLADLGLEFLHWPQQLLLKDDSKLHRDCYVLESQDSQNNGLIVRVKSWIDKESKAILAAEGYDAKGDKQKEFTLSGSSFKKINNRWQLKKITIFSKKKKSETVLQFDLPKN